ncbi:outer membrane lipoprotein carrier protein LolA [Campylobacter sp. CCUG 57310]|uniref:outer membrane lipoprotein carrier protein LolA n=1 Tax=Campylobacter sp. CCUG 57310 TaxID=2517362 RepID=UPI001564DCAF|nr:outer membrane lipoprotein carrier protein LolA [Campylobacter sp. CCUG 57310]QKF92317.1 putative LolA family chaperone [Campylobacter sp. CCUG 57310]
MKNLIAILSLGLSLFATNFEEIKSNIKTQNISGNFTQTKILKGFNNAFKSYGSFSLNENELLWQNSKPISSTLIINKDGVFQKNGDDLIKTGQNFDEKLFLALVRLDENELKKEFEYKISSSSKGWYIVLTPKNLLLKQIFTQISLSGDEFLKRLELDEVSGDKTINEFYDIK